MKWTYDKSNYIKPTVCFKASNRNDRVLNSEDCKPYLVLVIETHLSISNECLLCKWWKLRIYRYRHRSIYLGLNYIWNSSRFSGYFPYLKLPQISSRLFQSAYTTTICIWCNTDCITLKVEIDVVYCHDICFNNSTETHFETLTDCDEWCQ